MSFHSTEFKTATQGQAIAEAALQFRGHPFVSSPDRADCFDCVALINALTSSEIPASWMQTGGRLPFDAIAPEAARVGDLLVILDRDTWLMAVLTDGADIDDQRAQVFTCRRCRAAGVTWLAPVMREQIVAAYRLPVGGA